ncbi:hypothetical protein C7S15_6039 [Burkholderia cepacia]|nr:hypothetical protein [Burkholderia cepacia]
MRLLLNLCCRPGAPEIAAVMSSFGFVSNFVFKAYHAVKEDVCLANRKPNR